MANYDRQIASALRMIAKYGMPCTWVKVRDVFLPGNGSKPVGQVEEKFTASMVFFPYTFQNAQLFHELAGFNLTVGNEWALMPTVSFEPNRVDKITRAGTTYSIVALSPLKPAEQTVLWTIDLSA